jgi:predicted nucleotidyltransferase
MMRLKPQKIWMIYDDYINNSTENWLSGELTMERLNEIKEKILPILLPYGVKRIAVFGSYARGDETPESDIDLLIDIEEPRKIPIGLFMWVRLENELSAKLGKNVDLISHKGLNRHIRPYIESEMVVIYDQN